MTENHASKKAYNLDDVEYFDYFNAQIKIDGGVLDEFVQRFDQINIKDFNGIAHYNTSKVIKHMVKKRRGYIERSAEIKKQIAILEREKADAVKSLNAAKTENGYKQQRIEELESFWTIEKTNLDSQIAQLKGEIVTLKKDAKDNNGISERYRTERNTAERELENIKETLKVVNEECKAFKENNVQLEVDLNATNDKIRDLENQLEQMNFFQNEIEQLKKDFNAKDSELKNVQRQFESAKKELKQKKEEIETLNKKNAELDSNLNDAKKQINELQTQKNQLNKDFEAQDDELKIVQTQLKEFKEKCKNLEESSAIQGSQMTQIVVEQLEQALTCSREQCGKYQKELNEIRKEKERKSAALKALFESVKDVRVKTSCKLKCTLVKNMTGEQQNIINGISTDYSNLFHEYTRLNRVNGKSELLQAKKRQQRNEKALEKYQLSKERHQTVNNENAVGSSSKRARHETQQQPPPPTFNFFPPSGHQLIQGQISTSPPTLPSPPNLTPQLLVPAQPSNIGIVNVQPNAFPFLIPQLNQGFGPSNMFPSPNLYNFPLHLQQQILLHQEMLNGRFNAPNEAPPMNPSMPPINNGNNNHQNQQQLPSSNGVLEIMPPTLQHQQHHPLCAEQFNAFKQWQQKQPPPPFTPHILPPLPNHKQQ